MLNDTGFSAVHVPEKYGGQGADAVATCIVMEEVARVCASSSLIPGVNKLGTIGLILRGSDELKSRCCRRWPLARDFQGVQFMLADMAMKIEAARVMVYPPRRAPTRREGARGVGGAGYTVDFPVERMMRDAKITQIYEGTNQIQRVVMARALLT